MIGDRVFIVELTGCEWGGVAPAAFDSREKAQAWIDDDHAKDKPPYSIDFYEIKELVIQ